MKAAKLTERQKRFVDFYLITLNATEAARRAGYSAKHANQIGPRNMKIPEIRKAISGRLKQLEDGRIANVREVMERITSIARNELTEEVVVTEGQGRGKSRARVITKDVPIHDRLGALRILLFLYGLDRPAGKQERGTVTIVDDVRGSGQDENGN